MGVPINNVTRRIVFAASGTGPYSFTFEILAASDIAVYRDNTLLVLTTDYTVTINPNGTGYVTLTATPTGATQIAIVGNRTISRTTDFVTGGDFFANSLNDELDQQTIFAQQNAEGLGRALQAPQTDPTTINMTLPGRTTRANRYLSFDSNGNPVATAGAPNTLYYGSYASDPTTRPDGTAMVNGDLYFNSTDEVMKYRVTAGWQTMKSGALFQSTTLATAGQTLINFSYIVGQLQVYINGVLLFPTEYTANNGYSITFNTALTLNDEITVVNGDATTFSTPAIVSTSEPIGFAPAGVLWLKV